MASRNNRSKNDRVSPLLIMLGFQLFQQLDKLPVKPPVTILLLGLNIANYIMPHLEVFGFYLSDIRSNALMPEKIMTHLLAGKGVLFNRLIFSGFIHLDDHHLYYNMLRLSLCWKGINLERSLGSEEFVKLVVFSLLTSHVLLVAIAFGLHELQFDDNVSGFRTGAVGFSAVLFSLKYVLNSSAQNDSVVMGIQVPTRYAAWLELVLVSMITPRASFIGHLAGILAGIIYVHGLGLLRMDRIVMGTENSSRGNTTYSSGVAWQRGFEYGDIDHQTAPDSSIDAIRRRRIENLQSAPRFGTR